MLEPPQVRESARYEKRGEDRESCVGLSPRCGEMTEQKLEHTWHKRVEEHKAADQRHAQDAERGSDRNLAPNEAEDEVENPRESKEGQDLRIACAQSSRQKR